MKIAIWAAGLAALAGLSAGAAPAHETSNVSAEKGGLDRTARDAAQALDAFHEALRQGDTQKALGQLADDAVIYESGGVERSKADYAAQHLMADADFAKAVGSRIVRRSGFADGSVAWILTEGRTTGIFRDRPVDRVTTETAVLRRNGNAWRIVHVHWSSAAAKPAN